MPGPSRYSLHSVQLLDQSLHSAPSVSHSCSRCFYIVTEPRINISSVVSRRCDAHCKPQNMPICLVLLLHRMLCLPASALLACKQSSLWHTSLATYLWGIGTDCPCVNALMSHAAIDVLVSFSPGIDLDQIFTTDLASTPVHVAKWGFLGESWPFFRPNFVNMEQYKTDMSVDEVSMIARNFVVYDTPLSMDAAFTSMTRTCQRPQ